MRRTAISSFGLTTLAVLGGLTGILCLAPAASAGQTMMATLKPVDTEQNRVGREDYGTVKFTQGKGKVDVLVQADGVPLGGSELQQPADGGPASVGFKLRIVKSSDCAIAEDQSKVLAELPELRIHADGTGILMTSTDKVSLEQIAGKAVVLTSPRNETRVGCGLIKSE
jgi:hypothetical protein